MKDQRESGDNLLIMAKGKKRKQLPASSASSSEVVKTEQSVQQSTLEKGASKDKQFGLKRSAPQSDDNPLLKRQRDFLLSLTSDERQSFFSDDVVNPKRRAEIWMAQADLGEELVNSYSWATPDERALRILAHFQPIIEIGCGANAYWCRQMKQAGIDVVGFDLEPRTGGKLSKSVQEKGSHSNFKPNKGGPEVLTQKVNLRRTLFLCYPDENDTLDPEGNSFSLGAACLHLYTGDYLIHVGEIFGDTLSMEQAPWGRSSSPEFQQQLAAEFHCVLRAKLPSWLHTNDTLTVWKRSKVCTIVFAAEDEDKEDDDANDEVQYRHLPVEERLPDVLVAPCFAHLVLETTPAPPPRMDSRLSQAVEKQQAFEDGKLDYECPW